MLESILNLAHGRLPPLRPFLINPNYLKHNLIFDPYRFICESVFANLVSINYMAQIDYFFPPHFQVRKIHIFEIIPLRQYGQNIRTVDCANRAVRMKKPWYLFVKLI